MAYQRLQVTRALPVYSTTTGINIPDPDFAGISGTSATSGANKLTVAAANTFTADTVQTGFIVENVSTGAYARVTAIDSGTQLSLSGNIFTASGDNYQIYSQSTRGCILYCGGAGDIKLVTAAGDTVEYIGLQAGQFLPIQVVRIEAPTGSDIASNFIAHW
jgi:hypothetical protein|tara:strand:- start:2537 stop:3019 length:483 start_codon:yes stop_codon:yes gene_type:complete